MSEGLTPERRAEIEAKIAKPYADDVDGYRSTELKCAFMDAAIPEELLAEIDRLNKVVDQAIEVADIPTLFYERPNLFDGIGPDLAAELQRRGK